MTNKKYDILGCETLFQGFFRVDRYHIQYEQHNGAWSQPHTREVFHRCKQVAGILPFDPKNDKVVLVEQFRAGPLMLSEYPWLIELPMGMVDSNETPERAARREAFEEAGCQIEELQTIAHYFSSPGGTSEHISLFVGRAKAPEDGSVFGMSGENEDIRVHVLDAVQAIGLIYGNKIRDAQTLVALQWFAMHHTELRARWLMSDVGTPII
jgi:ADP-ribose pyrophosphatase